MKYGIAIFISLVLVVGMFAFHAYMHGKIEVWMTQNVAINPVEKMLCQIAFAIGGYWYAFVPTIVLICIGAAAMIPDRRENDQSA